MIASTLLPLIDPKAHPKYSPNLHAYIRRNWKNTPFDVVVTKPLDNGFMYVGVLHADDGWLSGSRLNSVLRNGAKEMRWAIGPRGQKIEADEDFWNQYIANGRCAVDPDHKTHFIGSETRWVTLGNDKRQCVWCGNCTQVKRQWVEQVQRSAWENEEKGNTP